MERKRKLLLLSSIVLLGICLWVFHIAEPPRSYVAAVMKPEPGPNAQPSVPALPQMPKPAQSPPRVAPDVVRKENEKQVWDLLLATPVNFYGKVVDENGTPIPGANVLASFANHLGDGGTKQNETTDNNGSFHVSGHGLGVVIQVSKSGYYHLKQSDGTFGYSKTAGQINPHPNAADPAVFVLRKAGIAAALIRVERRIRTSKSGIPVEISLTNGQSVPNGKGDIKVETWTQTPEANDFRYDWRCRISVPGGGLISRPGEFAFEAPTDGYAPFDEIAMPPSMGNDWSTNAKRQYFLKLADGRYARIEFKMIAEGNHYFVLTSYLNPQPGSRNLEYDPAKQTKAP